MIMKKEKVILDFGDNKKVEFEAQICDNVFSQARGLMFRSRRSSPALAFRFKRDVKEPIHSFFVFFPFVAAWLDSDGKIIRIQTVWPFLPYAVPEKKFRTLVEIPINSKNRKILDDIEKFK